MNYVTRKTACSLRTGYRKTGECLHLNSIMGKEGGKNIPIGNVEFLTEGACIINTK